jgi:hypothetical protein
MEWLGRLVSGWWWSDAPRVALAWATRCLHALHASPVSVRACVRVCYGHFEHVVVDDVDVDVVVVVDDDDYDDDGDDDVDVHHDDDDDG